MSATNKVIQLRVADQDRAAEVLARAFQDDPFYERIFADGDERRRSLRLLFGAVVGYGLRYGRVDTTLDVHGAACWLTPGNTEVTFWRMLRTGLRFQRAVATYPRKARRQLQDALAYMDGVHKRLMIGAHWYLQELGVDPVWQGQGIGGKLIQPVLKRSDQDGAPCYLETSSERNVAFYERWGFEVLSEGVPPGLGVRIWSMARQPLRAADVRS